MKDKLIEKVLKEFDEKLHNIEPETIATYLMISSYITEESLSNEYMIFLLNQPYTLDYLYKTYQTVKTNYNHYSFIKNCLKVAETDFLKTSETNHYE